jgi:hypothetical protein
VQVVEEEQLIVIQHLLEVQVEEEIDKHLDKLVLQVIHRLYHPPKEIQEVMEDLLQRLVKLVEVEELPQQVLQDQEIMVEQVEQEQI